MQSFDNDYYFLSDTFTTFPSKSRIAVPVCFATFSNSSILFFFLSLNGKSVARDFRDLLRATIRCVMCIVGDESNEQTWIASNVTQVILTVNYGNSRPEFVFSVINTVLGG